MMLTYKVCFAFISILGIIILLNLFITDFELLKLSIILLYSLFIIIALFYYENFRYKKERRNYSED